MPIIDTPPASPPCEARPATEYPPPLKELVATDLPPAHPLPLARPRKFSHQFSPAGEFERLAHSFQLRAPADGTDGLLGPYRGHGYCLAPLGREGDVRWFDPHLPAQHGDMVLVELAPDVLRGIVDRNRHKPEWLAAYGPSPGPIACKLLAAIGHSWWLLTADGAIELGDNRILGTCVRIERDGASIHDARPVMQIATGAATAVYSASDPDILVSLTAPATNATHQVLWATATVEAGDWIEVTGSFRIGAAFGGGSWHVDAFAMYGNTAGTSAVAIGEKLIKNAHAYEFAGVTGLVSLSAGTYRFGIGADLYSDGATNLDARFLSATVRATAIKR